ncbi:MAG TPA: hypothetical protein VKA84_21090 [Gemmatimonadaceae bacterium]|nr:hypothetical protein [Gemmatimonadaceae bacterium]
MHISPLRLALGAAAVASAAAAAAVVVTHPREAAAQQGLARPARFQVAALLGSPGAWVILDTESGDFEHWRSEGGSFSVARTRFASRTASVRTIQFTRGDPSPSSPLQQPPASATPAKREPPPPLQRTP